MIWTYEGGDFDGRRRLAARSSADTWELLTNDFADLWLQLAGRVNDVRFPRHPSYNTATFGLFREAGTVTVALGDDEEPWNRCECLAYLHSALIELEHQRLPDVDEDEQGFSDGWDAITDRVGETMTAAAARPEVVRALRQAEAVHRLLYRYQADICDHQLINELVLPHQVMFE